MAEEKQGNPAKRSSDGEGKKKDADAFSILLIDPIRERLASVLTYQTL